jgi:hypothetical protein
MKMLWMFVWVAICLGLSPHADAASATDQLVVTWVRGEVAAVRDGMPIPIHAGAPYLERDTFRTSSNGTLDIAMSGVAGCRILPSSHVKVRKIGRHTTLQVVEGRVILNLDKLPPRSSFEVETPSAVAVCRGTQFWVRVLLEEPSNPVTTFAVRKGAVLIDPKGLWNTYPLKEGQAIDIPFNKKMLPVVRPARDEELNVLYQAEGILTSL